MSSGPRIWAHWMIAWGSPLFACALLCACSGVLVASPVTGDEVGSNAALIGKAADRDSFKGEIGSSGSALTLPMPREGMERADDDSAPDFSSGAEFSLGRGPSGSGFDSTDAALPSSDDRSDDGRAVNAPAVPEPSSMALFAFGLLFLFFALRRRIKGLSF